MPSASPPGQATGSPGPEPVQVAIEGAVATVTVVRPEQANSLTTAAKEGLLAALEAVANDRSIRSVVLTGSGRAFCAGQDLVEHAEALATDPAHAFDTVAKHYSPIVQSLATMPKPVIAAINGTCAGAGIGLALACDLRIAAAGVKFAPAFTGIGLTADSGLSATLPRAVGWSRAMGLLLLGTVIEADEAERIGLVHEVVPVEELTGHVAALASRLAAGPTQAYIALKEALWYSSSAALEDVLRLEGELQARLATTADHQGAVQAFLARRRPDFTGT
ncbi:MAG TPA: enoyl-CoA hydratase-related protein [Acidimicrobiales bacterium]|nr:enoyl-CoA hydratase-related protein [Acidimicrobiales bacterium]